MSSFMTSGSQAGEQPRGRRAQEFISFCEVFFSQSHASYCGAGQVGYGGLGGIGVIFLRDDSHDDERGLHDAGTKDVLCTQSLTRGLRDQVGQRLSNDVS